MLKSIKGLSLIHRDCKYVLIYVEGLFQSLGCLPNFGYITELEPTDIQIEGLAS